MDRRPPAPDPPAAIRDDRIIGRAFRWSLLVIAALAVTVLIWLRLGSAPPATEPIVERGAIAAPARLDQSVPEMPPLPFTDITTAAGIRFVHANGARGDKLLPETMGSGAAFFDADADGDPDLLLVNSDLWPGAPPGPRPMQALYRNDGGGRFTDITPGSGLDVSLYGQGVAVGDYDDDGHVDVYLTAVGRNRLLRNTGGRFEDVTASAGVAGPDSAWSSSAGFFDMDADGDLDLFVCNYVEWSRDLDLKLNFTLNGIDRAYGPPMQYPGAHSILYRNDGDGRFTDISESAGIRVPHPSTGRPMGKALALTFADPDRDGDLDIFVANDTVQNFVFRNNGDATFTEIGTVSGVGFDAMGQATGAMGIDAAESRDDGILALGIGNFANETTSYFVQQDGPWRFVDMSNIEGIGSPSLLRLSFGLFFFDADLDGRLDLLQANGHLEEAISQVQPSQSYRQPAQLFWNTGLADRACFAAVPEAELGDLARPRVGRGAAYADIDGDGDLDVLITQSGGAPALLRNDQSQGHRWLRARLTGEAANRDAIGAEMELRTGGSSRRRTVMPTRSYLSQVELALTFGLGEDEAIEGITVRWPGGGEQRVPVPASLPATLVVTQAPRD